MTEVITKIYPSPAFSLKNALRYAGCGNDGQFDCTVLSLYAEAEKLLRYAVCFAKIPVSVEGEKVTLGTFRYESSSLAKNLAGCDRAVIFAATVGLPFDRLLEGYSRTSPSKAVFLQGIGAERIEALCDAFCEDLSRERGIRPRFSPGYGDFKIVAQKDIFTLLSPEKRIGLTVTDSFMMSPTKSVTAVIGIENNN